MREALVAGERDPEALAQLARTRLRAKLGQLTEAFTGHFTDHHGFLLATMLGRIDQASADIATLEAKIGEQIAPFQQAAEPLYAIPGAQPPRAPPRASSSPRPASTWVASPPPATWPPGPATRPGSSSQPARPRATAAPATATPTSPGVCARAA